MNCTQPNYKIIKNNSNYYIISFLKNKKKSTMTFNNVARNLIIFTMTRNNSQILKWFITITYLFICSFYDKNINVIV